MVYIKLFIKKYFNKLIFYFLWGWTPHIKQTDFEQREMAIPEIDLPLKLMSKIPSRMGMRLKGRERDSSNLGFYFKVLFKAFKNIPPNKGRLL